jgi:hypothetical protein
MVCKRTLQGLESGSRSVILAIQKQVHHVQIAEIPLAIKRVKTITGQKLGARRLR